MCASGLFAQELAFQNVIPPSPNSASLGKYGEIPVSEFTGVANITIPLYEVVVDDLKVPISLSYHSSGHRVGERASWVGLGWSLNAGGVITRSMRGRPDESGFDKNIALIKSWYEKNLQNFIFKGYTGDDTELLQIKKDMNKFYSQKWDVTSDFFYYNASGNAGKFVFNQDREIIQLPFKDLQIEPNNIYFSNNLDKNGGEISGFSITDMSGIESVFDIPEITSVRYPGTDVDSEEDIYKSAWYLSKLKSKVSGSAIDFSYSQPITLDDDIVKSLYCINKYTITGGDDISFQESYSYPSTEAVYIKEINFNLGKIVFEKSGNRLDFVEGGQTLDEIKIYNLQGKLVRRFKFYYSYFGSVADPLLCHLKLDRITQINISEGPDTVEIELYSFGYFDGVPPRDSYAKDHLGYFNAAINNTTLIPYYLTSFNTKIELADREPGNKTSRVGLLKEIIHPTKGKTQFNYEANTFYRSPIDLPENQLRIRSINLNAEICNEDGLVYIDEMGNGVLGLYCFEEENAYISIPNSSRKNMVELWLNYNSNVPPQLDPDQLYVEVYEQTGSGENRIHILTSSENFKTFNNILENGKQYRIVAHNTIEGVSLRARVTTKYVEDDDYDILNSYTSGVRISSIVNIINEKSETVKFNYNYDYNAERSSGKVLINSPSYVSFHSKFLNPSLGGASIYTFSSGSANYMNHLDGSHIIYEQVERTQANNGSIRSYYSVDADELTLSSVNSPPNPENTSNFWKRGNKLSERTYDNRGQLVSEQKKYYSFHHKAESYSFSFSPRKILSEVSTGNEYVYHLAKQISGWARLDSIHTIKYGGDAFVSKAHNYYTNPSHILPTKTSSWSQETGTIETQRVYFNNRFNHIITPIKSQISLRDNQIVNQKQNSLSSTGKLTSSSIFDKDFSLISSKSILYDLGLRPSYISDHKGNRDVFVWGYNKSKVIAHIKNTNVSSLASKIESLEALSNLDDSNCILNEACSESDLRLALNELRELPNLENALIETYTYDPLIGMTSKSDANGMTIFYRYDGYSRLNTILDQDGNILKKIYYKYKDED